jgi:HD-like signal output (HDOD) protein
VVLPALRRVHEDAGGVLARAWKLPEALCEAVPTHHDISGDGTICALAVAEHLVEEIAAVADPSVGEGDRTRYDNAIKMLRLDKGALQKLGQDAERIVTLALEEYGT